MTSVVCSYLLLIIWPPWVHDVWLLSNSWGWPFSTPLVRHSNWLLNSKTRKEMFKKKNLRTSTQRYFDSLFLSMRPVQGQNGNGIEQAFSSPAGKDSLYTLKDTQLPCSVMVMPQTAWDLWIQSYFTDLETGTFSHTALVRESQRLLLGVAICMNSPRKGTISSHFL